METQQIVLSARPEGFPTLNNFRIENVEVPDVQENEVLVEGRYYSVDPYMRGRMNDAKSYISTFQINQPITGGVVGKVIHSKASTVKEGDLVLSRLPWRLLNVVHVRELQKINASIGPPSYFLGILGMPGLTAYFGILDICKPKAGETGVISGAAGAVGIVAGQIAKIMGC
ncbi:MAG: NADP-dependent oxidoreductase, partial [Methanococcaceae archaeon]